MSQMSEGPMPSNPNQDPSEQSRINGVFDLPTPGRLSGWAIDRADPNAAVDVEIHSQGRLIAKVRADRHRADLERGGIGTGNYGFSVDLDPPIDPGMAFTLSVQAFAADGTSGPLRAVAKAKPSTDPGQVLLQQIYQQMADMRAEMADVRHNLSKPADAAEWQSCSETLDRIELAQARLDLIAAGTDTAPRDTGQSGLRLAVGIALASGLSALGLGLWSVLA